MALVCPDSGETLLLKILIGQVEAGNPVLHLYSNNIVPSDPTVIGDLTEVSAPGYGAITLTSADWTVGPSGGDTTASHGEETFSFTTGAVAYGYYVTDDSGNLMFLERFQNAPFSIPEGGGSIGVSTNLTLL